MLAELYISLHFPLLIWNIFLLLNGKSIFKQPNLDVISDKPYPFVVNAPVGDLPMFKEDISLEFCLFIIEYELNRIDNV